MLNLENQAIDAALQHKQERYGSNLPFDIFFIPKYPIVSLRFGHFGALSYKRS